MVYMHKGERWQLHSDVDAIRRQCLLQDNTTKTNPSFLRIAQSRPLLEDNVTNATSKRVVLRKVLYLVAFLYNWSCHKLGV